MRLLPALRAAALALLALAALPAAAEDSALLIQLQPDGHYRVWHSDGPSRLHESVLLELEAGARPEGGPVMQTLRGPAQAFETKEGVVIELPQAGADNRLFFDRDGCGGVKVWHAAGSTYPTEDELTELVLSALPEGGKRVKVGNTYARAFTTRVGVIAAIWKPIRRGLPGVK